MTYLHHENEKLKIIFDAQGAVIIGHARDSPPDKAGHDGHGFARPLASGHE
jgi:hypothetical protein